VWWMLLILTTEGWMAHSIYPTRTICEQQQMDSETQCVMVEVRFFRTEVDEFSGAARNSLCAVKKLPREKL